MSVNREQGRKPDKQWIRLAKLLSSRMRSGFPIIRKETRFAVPVRDRTHNFNIILLDQMIKGGFIRLHENRVWLTQNGLMEFKKRMGLLNTCTSSGSLQAPTNGQSCVAPVRAGVNLNESPLARLFHRKARNGQPYISENQFRAGEVLRSDFERGGLQPRLSANLDLAIGSKQKGSAAGPEISDFAIDARNRLNAALKKLDPELSGVALDICCFLKGFETVERERNWPPRSAKLMLRTALSILARHYGFERYENRGDSPITAWSAEDYRPTIS